MRVKAVAQPAKGLSLPPLPSGLFQRKCACGGARGLDGECAACRKTPLSLQRRATNEAEPSRVPPSVPEVLRAPGQPLDADTRGFRERRFGHDFSRVRVHSDEPVANATDTQSPPVSISGQSAIDSLEDLDEVFISGPPSVPVPAPAPAVPIPSPPPPAPSAPAPKAAASCPPAIKVAAVGMLQMDESFAKAGWLTGWGGFAQMEVSDPGGKDWTGTAIHENLEPLKNTCGEAAACSNAHGEGGAAGSTFTVGSEGRFLGLFTLAAKRNSFWDLHVIGMKGVSLLDTLGKPACEIQCGQHYDCGGKRFGPDFVIAYQLKRDVIKSGKNTYNVTRVELNKEAAK